MKKINFQFIAIFMFYLFFSFKSFANFNLEGINTNLDEITKEHSEEAKALQEQVSNQINNTNSNSNYNKYLRNAEQLRIKSNKHLFTQNQDVDEVMQGYYNQELTNSQKGSAGQGEEKTINHLLIFISFSMPEQALRERVMDAKKAGATLVLRGIIKDSMTETAIALNNLTDKTGVNAIIDPNLYKAFNVKVVPTIVIAKYSTYPCDINNNEATEVSCNYSPIHDKISGNISLTYALEQIISSKYTLTKPLAKKYLNKLRGGNNV
jgi:type-F conjugative transfer system pilin assembly protein TrbC